MSAYYNEFKPEAAAMLRQLIKDGIISDGEVDERSITEVRAEDVKGFTQCHWFAGIGGWSVALKQADWPDSRKVWTGSCPCQPFSSAGKQKGQEDERHLWPVWSKLIEECGPSVIFGEQVATSISHGWLDGVYADLEAQDYAVGSAVLPACAVNAPHRRDRLWFVAYGAIDDDRRNAGEIQGENELEKAERQEERHGSFSHASIDVGHSERQRQSGQGKMGESLHSTKGERRQTNKLIDAGAGFWSDSEWLLCGDNKFRRIPKIESGIRIVANGIQFGPPLLHAFGNAIVPEEASRFIKAVM